LSSPPSTGQWQSLFDGQTSAGWRTLAKPQFPTNGGWAVEDGTIRSLAAGKRADISNDRTFRNFELIFDWNLAKGTNSGVTYLVFGMRPNPEVGRIDLEVPKALGLELQLIDDERAADAKVEAATVPEPCTCSLTDGETASAPRGAVAQCSHSRKREPRGALAGRRQSSRNRP